MTSSQLATQNGSASDIAWTDEQKRLISSVIAPGCDKDELRIFAYQCQRTGLDPFSKQIYAIKRKGKMTVQVSIDGLRAIAERTGELSGSQRFWCGPDGEWKDVWLSEKPPAAAKCVVYRKDCSHPFVGIAVFRDYNAGVNLWLKMPSVMLGKCAEAQALRAGFPADLSGLYATEEMHQADSQSVAVSVQDVSSLPDAQQPAQQAAPALAAAPAEPEPASVIEPEVVEEEVQQSPEPEAAEPAPAAALSLEEQLAAAIGRLTATGKRALIKIYSSKVKAFADVTTIDQFLAIAIVNPSVHLKGLSDEAIAALNDGLHPQTKEVIVKKPGRQAPAAAAVEESDNPFA
jgi:phage recombination protein Bet